ncbi:hypothetical protein CEXT_557691 [Caerostris extrusa]|uniref:Uncharacterized protein n=1 Tax=Caerostris extrusa TaxID=172846 RepID=A0AAV4W6K3_CAEEX|nr:hypothetical protein CEXT_557691 [Caerostris extrusa]
MYSRSSSQDEFFTIYGNDIHDTGNSEEMRPSKFNASEALHEATQSPNQPIPACLCLRHAASPCEKPRPPLDWIPLECSIKMRPKSSKSECGSSGDES